MKAVIIAAGKAPRLLPLTRDTPQCLLKVRGKTILEHQVITLKKAGIRDISVVCGYMAGKVEEFCRKLGVKSVLNPFYDVSGMAMTLWVARGELKKGFIFIYSDILFDKKTISGLVKEKGDISIAIKRDGPREEAEKVVEKNGVVENISKARVEGENGEFIGIARFSDKGAGMLADELDKAAKKGLNTSLIEMIDSIIKGGGAVSAYDIKDARFIDIDFPEDLKKAEKMFSS